VFVWEHEVDGSAGEHDEGERGGRGVEPVAASDDEADFHVEPFDACVGDVVLDGVDDDRSPVAHRAGRLDERFQPGSQGAGDPTVERADGVDWFETGGEDRPELFFHLYARQIPPRFRRILAS
jgi:hypothetical protein